MPGCLALVVICRCLSMLDLRRSAYGALPARSLVLLPFFIGACLAGQGVVFLFSGNDYFARGKLYRGSHKYLPGSQKFQK